MKDLNSKDDKKVIAELERAEKKGDLKLFICYLVMKII